MFVQSISSSCKDLYHQCSKVLSNSDQCIEGGLWGAWFVYNVTNLKKVYSNNLTSQQKKTEKIWNRKKEILLHSCSVCSAGTMVLSWLNEVGILHLGIFNPLINVAGYGGSALVALFRALEGMKEINDGMDVFADVKDPRCKSDIALRQLQKIFQVALQISLLAWSTLGMMYFIASTPGIFLAMDTAFCAVLGLFFINLGFSLFLPSMVYSKQLFTKFS